MVGEGWGEVRGGGEDYCHIYTVSCLKIALECCLMTTIINIFRSKVFLDQVSSSRGVPREKSMTWQGGNLVASVKFSIDLNIMLYERGRNAEIIV